MNGMAGMKKNKPVNSAAQLRLGVAGQNGFNSSNHEIGDVLRTAFIGIQDLGDQMPIEIFEFWFHAIETDDHELIVKVLAECYEKEKMILLNGRFLYDCTPHNRRSLDDQQLPCAFQRPLVLATIYRATKTIQIFLKCGADLFVQDIGSNTVVHGIIWATALKPDMAQLYLHLFDFIMKDLTRDEKRLLLYIENSEGLRPLELSARLCTFNVFRKIFDTEGVYVWTKGRLGAHICCWFDVTDYESWDKCERRNRSPLKMLTLIEKEHLINVQQAKLHYHPAIRRWINAVISTNVPYLAIWFLIRILYTVLIFLCATADYSENMIWNVVNGTVDITQKTGNPCPEPLFVVKKFIYNILIFTVIGYSCMIVFFDITDTFIYYLRRKWRNEERCYHAFGSRNFVVRTRFYRICNFLLAATMLTYHTAHRIHYRPLATKTYMIANILNIWSLLFFVQLLPALGYFVTIIQRMLKDMFHFLILYLLLFFSFSQTFYNLFYMNALCTEEFNSVSWSMYSTFRVMLNMIELTQYDWKDGMTDIALLHTSYIIVVPILLVNFLIALMSNSVSDVAENRYLIMILQRLSAALLVESRLGNLIAPAYRYQQKGWYIVRDSRVYVECFILKDTATS